MSNLYVHILSGTSPSVINSLDDLIADKDAKIYFIAGTNTVSVFKNGKNYRYKAVWNKVLTGMGGLVPYTNWESILDENSYLITNKREAEFVLQRGAPVYIAKEDFYDVEYAFVVRRDLPEKPKSQINKVLRSVQESGMYMRLLHSYEDRLKRRTHYKELENYEIGSIRLEPIIYLFYMFFISIMICLLVFALEYLVALYMKIL